MYNMTDNSAEIFRSLSEIKIDVAVIKNTVGNIEQNYATKVDTTGMITEQIARCKDNSARFSRPLSGKVWAAIIAASAGLAGTVITIVLT